MDKRVSRTHEKEVLHQMRMNRRYCDFTLKFGNEEEEIKVHRNVLAACSAFFDAMFQQKMRESAIIAEISNIKLSVGKQCLEYVYTGEVDLCQENLENLISAADFMQLHGLVDVCFQYMLDNIAPESCLQYMKLAVNYNKESFGQRFEDFLLKNFEKVISSNDFTSATKTLLVQCLECLPEGGEAMEGLKFDAVKTWVEACFEHRQGNFPELFKLVNLENMPTKFLKLILKEDLVHSSDECKLQVYEAIEESRDSGEAHPYSPCSLSHILAYHKESRFLLQFNRGTNQWSRFARIPDEKTGCDFDVISHGGSVYFASKSGLFKFGSGSWMKISDLDVNEASFTRLTSHGDMIYLVTNSFHYQYDVKTSNTKRHSIPSHLQLGNGFCVAASNEFLYAVGGSGSGKKAIEFSVSGAQKWEPISGLHSDRENGSLLFYDGKLVVLGGGSYYAEYYEPSVDDWIWSSNKNSFYGADFKIFLEGTKVFVLQHQNLKAEPEELALEFTDAGTDPKNLHPSFFFPASFGK